MRDGHSEERASLEELCLERFEMERLGRSGSRGVDFSADLGWALPDLFEIWTSCGCLLVSEGHLQNTYWAPQGQQGGILWFWWENLSSLKKPVSWHARDLRQVTVQNHGLQPWLARTNGYTWTMHVVYFICSAFLLICEVLELGLQLDRRIILLFLLFPFLYFIYFL